MIKEIKYGGFTASPSDYESPDGELAALIGLVPDEGNLKPIMPPNDVLQLESGETVKFIHETSSYTHYIILGNYKAYWYDKKTKVKTQIEYFPSGVHHLNAVGNTLLAFSTSGIYYFLWKNNKYQDLGNHIPDVEVSFGLVGHPRLFSLSDDSKSTFNISFYGISEGALYNELSEANKTKITDQIMAKVNKFVAQETTNKGRFCFPFFVRYALRLYDGSLIYHSAPILMNPSTKAAPIVFWKRVSDKGSYSSAECDMMLVASTLDYRVLRNTDFYSLDDWGDIVKGVEVFISKPIYTYDQNGKITSFADTDNYATKFIGRLYAENRTTVSNTRTEDKLLGNFTNKDFLDHYCEWLYSHIYAMYYSSDRSYPATTFHLPEFSDNKVSESIHNTSTFYKLKTIEFADLIDTSSTGRKDIFVEEEYLQSLVTREVMTDDYLSRDQIYADKSFVYNSRLNLSGVRRKPFKGFIAQSMFAWCDTTHNWQVNKDNGTVNASIPILAQDDYSIKVLIKENGRDYEVTSNMYYAPYMALYNSHDMTVTDNNGNQRTGKNKLSFGCYLFYPNPNAYKMIIYNYSSPCYAVDLKPHEFLNGAYAVLDYELVRTQNFTSLPYGGYYAETEVEQNFPIDVPNKIYTSEVNNPFYFPVLGINTVGTGTILGISTAAKALSQGQFGQFPLYAFTTEGVWALEVSSTGGYSAKQPITRDVCINADSITQLDSAVLFATDRGIMLISGSNSQCISDTLDYSQVFSIDSLPQADKLVTMAGFKAEDFAYVPFRDYLLGCRMIYAYTQQRVIVYNPAHSYAYVYSLKTKTWGMMQSTVADNVPSYPEALAMLKDGTLVDFCTDAAQQQDEDGHLQGIKGLLITRPLKLDAPDLLKTIDTAIQRGNFRKGSIKSALYGSRDLQNWSLIWTSQDHYLRGFRGTPYKYFRFALLCDMQPDESLFGATIQYTPRLLNQPR